MLWERRRNPFCAVLLIMNRALYPLIRLSSGLELSPETDIGSGLYVGYFGPTVIHPQVKVGSNLKIVQSAIIGESRTGVPLIGDNVSIGAGVIIIGGIKVQDNVNIGAISVVTHDVLKGLTVIGIPAKPIISTIRNEISS